MPPRSTWLPWLAFTAISLIWGSTWLAHKWALADFTPLGLLQLRLLSAGALCCLLGRLRGEPWPERTDWFPLLFAGLILTGIANVATAWTLQYLPSGVGAVLQAPIPVWMALFSLKRDPLTASGWCAILLGLFGVAVVMWPSETSHFDVLASVVCVASAALWSWASLYQRDRVHSGGLFSNAGLQMLQGGLLGSVAIALGAQATQHGTITPAALWAVSYLVIFGSCIAFAAYLYLTKVWHPARAGSFSYLNPVVAVALGVMIGNEPITSRLLTGLIIILLAVGVLQYATSPRLAKAATKTAG